MKVAVISKAGGEFEFVERPVPEPGAGQVRIKVEACGICHSDVLVKEGYWPGIVYPRVPGHEVAGRIDAVGAGAGSFKVGDKVGVGWYGGKCGECENCQRGIFILCTNGGITGISHDGGYAEYMVVPHDSVAKMPEELSAAEAAPLMCAGITTFNALRHSGAKAGDVVAVQGIGGLGHLGVQYARKMGFETVAIGRGADKAALVKELGAHHYIDYGVSDPAAELQKLGGAKMILATAPNTDAISAIVGGLAIDGTLLIVAAPGGNIAVSPLALISGRKSVKGWPSGTNKDSEDTLRFSALQGVAAKIERFPFAQVKEAYERAMSGKARFRVVLTMV